MQVVDFSEKSFNEIPDQDNPAFEQGLEPCLMIVKSAKQHLVGNGVTVLEVKDSEDDTCTERVTSLGHFYTKENATKFADLIAGN